MDPNQDIDDNSSPKEWIWSPCAFIFSWCKWIFFECKKATYVTGFFFSKSSIRFTGEDLQHWLALNDDCPKWVVTFFQKCCYKSRPKKCLGLDVADLIIYILKNGEKIPRVTNFSCNFFFFWKKKIAKLQNLITQKKHQYYYVIILVGIIDSLDSICRALNGSARTDRPRHNSKLNSKPQTWFWEDWPNLWKIPMQQKM